MDKRKTIIREIGEQVIDHLFNDDNDYDIEQERGFYGGSVKTRFVYEHGNGYCDISCSVFWHRKGADVECVLDEEDSRKQLSCLEEAVNAYLEENLDTDGLLDAIKEKEGSPCYDEFLYVYDNLD